ncbi:FMN-binding protein [Paratractidigestivibacter sp.]|uniref:FMN-binding protein n=1 Tax=Paratractidigestivibacter sp. TaxID=2847316 RepID=UPI002ABDB6AD|nr:FMN-binding protein [Paratractidigestivibacter sp.]
MEDAKNKTARIVVRATCAALIVGAVAGYSAVVSAQEQRAAEAVTAAREAGQRGPFLKDGVFEGTARGYGGPTTVSVTVENGYVSKIEAVKEYDDSPYFDLASTNLFTAVVAQQTLDLDTVSSATFSSRGIINAINNALVAGGAIEGEKVGASTSSSTGAHSTSELKKLAADRAQQEAPEWYELTISDLLGAGEDASASASSTGKSSGNAGFAGGR